MLKLTGKVALVTGGSRGIGAAIAKRLAQDGAAVAITYSASGDKANKLVQELRAAGANVVALKADAADAVAVKNAVNETVKQLGALDIVVNNAGIGGFSEISQFSDELFEKMLAINVKSAYYTVREAARHLRDGGRIIMIGSVNSDSMPFVGGSVYALTKGAIASFTRGLARDLGPRGITVNNIQPGPVDTDLNPANGPAADGLKALMAIKHYGHSDDVAGLVSFLAGPEGAFITGAGIKIDGGFDA